MSATHGTYEQPLVFACEGEALIGILHRPVQVANAARATRGVVMIVGGPQYRAGSHRHFVDVARGLASAGHPVLRFDVRGMGDSTGELRAFDSLGADIEAAIDSLQSHQPAVQEVMLWGLCDGASAALLYLHEHHDARVRSLCLLNPWLRSTASRARTQVRHYYTQRLREREFWFKLLSGRIAVSALRDLLSTWRAARQPAAEVAAAPFQARMAAAWQTFDQPLLLILSGRDYTAREFIEFTQSDAAWLGALQRPNVSRIDLADADHTFSNSGAAPALAARTESWLQNTR